MTDIPSSILVIAGIIYASYIVFKLVVLLYF